MAWHILSNTNSSHYIFLHSYSYYFVYIEHSYVQYQTPFSDIIIIFFLRSDRLWVVYEITYLQIRYWSKRHDNTSRSRTATKCVSQKNKNKNIDTDINFIFYHESSRHEFNDYSTIVQRSFNDRNSVKIDIIKEIWYDLRWFERILRDIDEVGRGTYGVR